MADNDQPQQQFAIQSIYVKDVSFETPLGPSMFNKQWQPRFNVDLNTTSKHFQENSYEVVLTVTVTAKLEEETALLIEVQQGGLFSASGFEGEALRQMLGIVAPNTLFPYVRETIDSLCNRGGLPAIKLQPVNFEALYNNAVQEARKKQGETPAPSDAH